MEGGKDIKEKGVKRWRSVGVAFKAPAPNKL